jgi:hypothetical protein
LSASSTNLNHRHHHHLGTVEVEAALNPEDEEVHVFKYMSHFAHTKEAANKNTTLFYKA